MIAATRPVAEVRGADLDYPKPLQRLRHLLDGGFLVPLHDHDDSGVVAVRGWINGAAVLAYCTDATRIGGALGAAGSAHVVTAIDRAVRENCPVIGVWQSGGARLGEGVESLDGVGRMFAAMTHASGEIPQISVVVGPAAGAAAYGPALTDIVIMSSAARMFVTGPEVVRSVTGEQIDMQALGGPDTHSRKSGVAHVVVDSEADAWARARRITTLFTQPGEFKLGMPPPGADPGSLLPACHLDRGDRRGDRARRYPPPHRRGPRHSSRRTRSARQHSAMRYQPGFSSTLLSMTDVMRFLRRQPRPSPTNRL